MNEQGMLVLILFCAISYGLGLIVGKVRGKGEVQEKPEVPAPHSVEIGDGGGG